MRAVSSEAPTRDGALRVPRSAVLANGLKVLIEEAHTAPLVSVWCWYRVGSKDESPGLTGASHWVEHMNFKGTAGIPAEEFKELIDRFGGFWNGYTWIDQTTYVETATKDALDQMLFMEAERMDRCLYDAEACESERTVIISELQGGENDPDQLLDIEVTATAFKAHAYRHPTIGWIGDLRAMSRDELYGHYRRHYTRRTRRWSSSATPTPMTRSGRPRGGSARSRRGPSHRGGARASRSRRASGAWRSSARARPGI